MGTIADLTVDAAHGMWKEMAADVKASSSLEEAAGKFVTGLYRLYETGLVLVRVFAIVPFGELPDRNRQWVRNLAQAKHVVDDLNEDTMVLSLVGTHGDEEAWNDIRTSEGHVGIPLTSSDFVSAVPMFARLLKDLEVNELLVLQDGSSGSSAKGSKTFHVPHAKQTVDSEGRHVVPAQDFVEEHKIHTVFGVGGPHAEGSKNVILTIFFTKEDLPRETAESFEALMDDFTDSIAHFIDEHRVFS